MNNQLYRFFKHHMIDRRHEPNRRIIEEASHEPERRHVNRRKRARNKITIKTAPAKIICHHADLSEGLSITTTISVSKNH